MSMSDVGYPNDVFQSNIFVSDIGITDVDVGCRISPTLRSMSMPTYDVYVIHICIVPDSKSRNIPEVVFVRRWAVGVLGIWKEWDSWVKGGANGVSLQAT